MSQQTNIAIETSEHKRSPLRSAQKQRSGDIQENTYDGTSNVGASTMNDTNADFMRSRSSSGGGGSCKRRGRSLSNDPDSQDRTFIYPCQAFKQFLLSMNKGGVNINDFASSPHLMEYMNYTGERGRDKDSKPFAASLRQSSQPRSNSRSKLNSKSQASLADGLNLTRAKDSIIEEDEGEDGGYNNSKLNKKSPSRATTGGYQQNALANKNADGSANNKRQSSSEMQLRNGNNISQNNNSGAVNQSNTKQGGQNFRSSQIQSLNGGRQSSSTANQRGSPQKNLASKSGQGQTEDSQGPIKNGQQTRSPLQMTSKLGEREPVRTKAGQYNGKQSPLQMISQLGEGDEGFQQSVQKINQRSPQKTASYKPGARDGSGTKVGNQIQPQNQKTPLQMTAALGGGKGGDNINNDVDNKKHNFNPSQQDKQKQIYKEKDSNRVGGQSSIGNNNNNGKSNISGNNNNLDNNKSGAKNQSGYNNGPSNNINNQQKGIPVLEKSFGKDRRGRNERSNSAGGRKDGSDEEQVHFSGVGQPLFEQDQRFDDKGKPIQSTNTFRQQQSLIPAQNLTKNNSAISQPLVGAVDRDYPDDQSNTNSNMQNKQRRGRKQRSSMPEDMSSNYDGDEPKYDNYSPYHEPRSVSSLPVPLERENTPQRSAKNTNPHKSIANMVGEGFQEDENDKQFDSNDYRSKQKSPLKSKHYQEDLGQSDHQNTDQDDQNQSNPNLIDEGQESDKGLIQKNSYSAAAPVGMSNSGQKKTPGRGERKKDAQGNNLGQSNNYNDDNSMQNPNMQTQGRSPYSKNMEVNLASDDDNVNQNEGDEIHSYHGSPKGNTEANDSSQRHQSPNVPQVQRRSVNRQKDSSGKPTYQSGGVPRNETQYNPDQHNPNNKYDQDNDNIGKQQFKNQDNDQNKSLAASDLNDRENSDEKVQGLYHSPNVRGSKDNQNPKRFLDNNNINGSSSPNKQPQYDQDGKQIIGASQDGSPGDLKTEGQGSAKQRRGRHNRGSPSQTNPEAYNSNNSLGLQEDALRQAIPKNYFDEDGADSRKLSPISKDKSKLLNYDPNADYINDEDNNNGALSLNNDGNDLDKTNNGKQDGPQSYYEEPLYQKEQRPKDQYGAYPSSQKKKQPRRERNNAGGDNYKQGQNPYQDSQDEEIRGNDLGRQLSHEGDKDQIALRNPINNQQYQGDPNRSKAQDNSRGQSNQPYDLEGNPVGDYDGDIGYGGDERTPDTNLNNNPRRQDQDQHSSNNPKYSQPDSQNYYPNNNQPNAGANDNQNPSKISQQNRPYNQDQNANNSSPNGRNNNKPGEDSANGKSYNPNKNNNNGNGNGNGKGKNDFDNGGNGGDNGNRNGNDDDGQYPLNNGNNNNNNRNKDGLAQQPQGLGYSKSKQGSSPNKSQENNRGPYNNSPNKNYGGPNMKNDKSQDLVPQQNNSSSDGPQSFNKKPNKQSQNKGLNNPVGKGSTSGNNNKDSDAGVNDEEKQPTKLRELEKELKEQIAANPQKPLNYALLLDIQAEAAKTIQQKFREHKAKNVPHEEVVNHPDGKFSDRQCQTDPLIMGLPNNLMLNDEKFKKFMTAMLYSYKMVSNALGDQK